MRPARTLRIAAVQDAPVFLDTAATVERMVGHIEAAGRQDVRLVAFGETFLPGYPFWLSSTGGAAFDDPGQKAAFAAYLDAAVDAEGPELRAIEAACRRTGVAAVVGFAERGRGVASGSTYCSLSFVHPERGAAAPHRKLVPTYEERLVWAPGDGHGLRAHELDGISVTALNCWENWMPQARHAMYAAGAQLHVAIWPGSVGLTRDITRFVAREGRIFVLSTGAILRAEDVGSALPVHDRLPTAPGHVWLDGGSCVAGPDGEWRVPPRGLGDAPQGLVIADIDLSEIGPERQNFDPTGHYARPDVFEVRVDRRRRAATTFSDGHGGGA